ncbi:MAG TPA: hypothetical protein VKD22_17960 [Ramlibacter sp.]|nr:hypothetical protein [Ramlibacter sp.]
MPRHRYHTRGKYGSGTRFKHLENTLAHRHGVHDASALAAWIGRKKHGGRSMARVAGKGRHRAAVRRHH